MLFFDVVLVAVAGVLFVILGVVICCGLRFGLPPQAIYRD